MKSPEKRERKIALKDQVTERNIVVRSKKYKVEIIVAG